MSSRPGSSLSPHDDDRGLVSRHSPRPTSAHSRTAWSDDGIDNPMGPRAGSRNDIIDADPDLPAAMESEMYDSTVRVEDNHPPVIVQETSNGCWFKFKRGIRCKFEVQLDLEISKTKVLIQMNML